MKQRRKISGLLEQGHLKDTSIIKIPNSTKVTDISLQMPQPLLNLSKNLSSYLNQDQITQTNFISNFKKQQPLNSLLPLLRQQSVTNKQAQYQDNSVFNLDGTNQTDTNSIDTRRSRKTLTKFQFKKQPQTSNYTRRILSIKGHQPLHSSQSKQRFNENTKEVISEIRQSVKHSLSRQSYDEAYGERSLAHSLISRYFAISQPKLILNQELIVPSEVVSQSQVHRHSQQKTASKIGFFEKERSLVTQKQHPTQNSPSYDDDCQVLSSEEQIQDPDVDAQLVVCENSNSIKTFDYKSFTSSKIDQELQLLDQKLKEQDQQEQTPNYDKEIEIVSKSKPILNSEMIARFNRQNRAKRILSIF